MQSVPWRLARVRGRTITVDWSSGTRDATVRPDSRIDVAETSRSITIRVLAHIVMAGQGAACAGVGLSGTLSTTLRHPIAGRRIVHGVVTDRQR